MDTKVSHACEEIGTQQRSQNECDQHHEDDRDAYSGEPCGYVGASLLDLIDNVEAVLSGREANRGRPDCRNEAEGELAAGCSGGGLVEGFEDCPQGVVRDDNGEIAQKRIVDLRGRARGETED
jgi:hypothetical protein